MSKKSPFIENVRNHLRVRHYSLKTERAYIYWIKKYILFHHKRHPLEMGEEEIGSFLTHVAKKEKVAAATQNQALNALIFMYKVVLRQNIGEIQHIYWSKKPKRLPVVLSKGEVQLLMKQMTGRDKCIT